MTDIGRDRYRDLQRLARAGGRPADELMTLYALEGFLARLVTTNYHDTFVLKGGILLAALDTRRPTRDIDVQALDFDNDGDRVLEFVRAVLAVDLDDGLAYDLGSVTVEQVREDNDYPGVRIAIGHALTHVDTRLVLVAMLVLGRGLEGGAQRTPGSFDRRSRPIDEGAVGRRAQQSDIY